MNRADGTQPKVQRLFNGLCQRHPFGKTRCYKIIRADGSFLMYYKELRKKHSI